MRIASVIAIALYSLCAASYERNYDNASELHGGILENKGQGAVVAIIGTGTYTQHASFSEKRKSIDGTPFAVFVNATGGAVNDFEAIDHETASASIIAGNGPVYGIAPQASIISVKVGAEYWEIKHLRRGLQYILDVQREGKVNIDVLNFSGSGPVPADYIDDLILDLYQAGILMVCSAGNTENGPHYGIGYPASHPLTVAVACIEPGDTDNPRITDFSCYDETCYFIPSREHVAADASGDFGLYRAKQFDGTSFAAPVVTGIVALLASDVKRNYPWLRGSEKCDYLRYLLDFYSVVNNGTIQGMRIPVYDGPLEQELYVYNPRIRFTGSGFSASCKVYPSTPTFMVFFGNFAQRIRYSRYRDYYVSYSYSRRGTLKIKVKNVSAYYEYFTGWSWIDAYDYTSKE